MARYIRWVVGRMRMHLALPAGLRAWAGTDDTSCLACLQLVERMCEEEMKALRSEVEADHDMARAFRKEKAAVLQAVLDGTA